MACRTGRPTCSARSACYCLRLAVLLLPPGLAFIAPSSVAQPSVAQSGVAQSSNPSDVHDCRPCAFSPGGKFPSYSFTFVLKTTGGGRVVEAIEVAQGSKPVQRLAVPGMDPIGVDEDFFFGGADINFDGLLDLLLITRRGAANAYAAYWLFDPKEGAFTALGVYPVFRVDAGRRRLSTYERGGAAGLIHEAKEYAFEDGKLTLVRDERQESTAQPGIYRNVIRERAGGVMRVVKTEKVHAPQ